MRREYRFLRLDGRPALSRRTRLRLAAIRRVDTVCDWLLERDADRLAIAIWRACGLWPHGQDRPEQRQPAPDMDPNWGTR